MSMMPLGGANPALITVDVELDHHCPHCGTVSPALVRGRGFATESRSLLDLGGSDAQFKGEVTAQRDAALLIRLARCPACGKRDPKGIRVLWMRAVWVLLGAVALDLIAMTMRDADVPWHHALGLLAGFVGGIWLLLAAVAWRQLRGSNERVRFITPPAPPAGPYRS
jgi:hypothetical protein